MLRLVTFLSLPLHAPLPSRMPVETFQQVWSTIVLAQNSPARSSGFAIRELRSLAFDLATIVSGFIGAARMIEFFAIFFWDVRTSPTCFIFRDTRMLINFDINFIIKTEYEVQLCM